MISLFKKINLKINCQSIIVSNEFWKH